MERENSSCTVAPRQGSFFCRGWLRWLIPPSALSVLTVVFYYPTLKYPFQFDDLANITKNFNIRSFDFWGELGTTQRWLGTALNKLNFQWGRFDPWYYRSVNLTVHILSGLVVFFLIAAICVRQRKSEFLSRNALWISSLVSALFLLHPIQTQAVCYVIQARLEGLASFFVLLTVLLMVLALQSRSLPVRILLFGLGTVVGVVSCGTKEIVAVTPLLLMLIDWFFVSEWDWNIFRGHLIYHAIFTAAIFFTLLHFLGVGFMGNVVKLNAQTHNNKGNILTNGPMDMITPAQFMISEFKVILHHLRMAFFPVGMSVEYDWKLSESFLAPDSFFPFLALALIFGGAFYAAFVFKERLVTFGFFWFLISVLPRCSIIASPELVCDYKAYLAYAGLFFSIAILLIRFGGFIYEKYSIRDFLSAQSDVLSTISLAVMTLFFGGMSLARNKVWSSTVVFWEDAVRKAPGKARAHNNLGTALSEEGQFERAIPHYLQAVQLDRFYSDPWSNLAVAYSVSGKDDEAIEASKQALRLSPSYPEAYNNLGTLLLQKKKYDEAQNILEAAINLRPYYGKAFFNLGRLFLEKGENDKAWEYFQKATQGDLDTKEGFFALGQVGIRLGHYKEAIEAFKKSVAVGSLTPQLEFCLANAYYLDGQIDKAERSYQSLHKRFPGDGRFTYNLAETLFVKKRFDEAEMLFRECWAAGDDFPSAYSRVASCVESSKGAREALDTLITVSVSGKLGPRASEIVNKELGRLRLQDKITNGDGVITGKDLREAFGEGVVGEASA